MRSYRFDIDAGGKTWFVRVTAHAAEMFLARLAHSGKDRKATQFDAARRVAWNCVRAVVSGHADISPADDGRKLIRHAGSKFVVRMDLGRCRVFVVTVAADMMAHAQRTREALR